MDPPPEMVAILATFAPLFSDRVWTKAQLLAAMQDHILVQAELIGTYEKVTKAS